jgi:hypothetical protein
MFYEYLQSSLYFKNRNLEQTYAHTLFIQFSFIFYSSFFNIQKINELKSKEKRNTYLDIRGYLPPSCLLLLVFRTAVRTKGGQTAYPSYGSVGFGSAGSQGEFVHPGLASAGGGEVYAIWWLGSPQCL